MSISNLPTALWMAASILARMTRWMSTADLQLPAQHAPLTMEQALQKTLQHKL
jgi:hypothetical protein